MLDLYSADTFAQWCLGSPRFDSVGKLAEPRGASRRIGVSALIQLAHGVAAQRACGNFMLVSETGSQSLIATPYWPAPQSDISF
jgi:hypothetical protein